MESKQQLRRAVLWVAVLNAAYFGVEFVVGTSIRSVSLIADSIDFLEDSSINLLILVGLGMAARSRARMGSVLAIIIFIPGLAALVSAVDKFLHPAVPGVTAMSVTAFGALLTNGLAALILSRVRHHEGSLVTAAWLSARNDVLANVAIIAAALASLWIASPAWDIAVGLAIVVLNSDAAIQVWRRSRAALKSADATP